MYKRGNAWCMKVRRPDGRSTTITLGKGITKTEARKIETQIRAEINAGKFFDIRKGEYLPYPVCWIIFWRSIPWFRSGKVGRR